MNVVLAVVYALFGGGIAYLECVGNLPDGEAGTTIVVTMAASYLLWRLGSAIGTYKQKEKKLVDIPPLNSDFWKAASAIYRRPLS